MKTVLITGATDGIGQQAAIELARLGYAVIVHGRSQQRVEAVVEAARQANAGVTVDGITADFSDLEQVRAMAARLSGEHPRLFSLVNNAGVFEPTRHVDDRGLERTFVISHLAHFLLTGLLLPTLTHGEHTRIINVSSMAHAHHLDFKNLQGENGYSGESAYSRAKLCNVLFTKELAARLGADSPVTVNALHPGVISTKLLHAGWGIGGAPLQQGAETEVDAVHNPAWTHITGAYFMNKRPTKPARIADDSDVREHLWRLSEEWTGVRYP